MYKNNLTCTEVADFAKRISRVIYIYGMLTSATKPTINWRPPLYYKINLWTNQKLQEIVLAKTATFGVKSILLSLVPSTSK